MRYLLFFLLVSFVSLQAQDYAAVDARVKQYPKRFGSTEALALQIQKDFNSDSEKVRAIFTWLATNIAYDMNEYLNGERLIRFQYRNQQELAEKQRAIREYSINSTLNDNKAVCEGFAQTFKKVCELMGIRCLFIEGYSKINVNDIGRNPKRGDHAWNAVKINNQWKLIDVTWASGSANGTVWKQKFNDYYFFTDADEFVKTHLPSTKGLSFAKKEPSKKEFFDAPIYTTGYFRNRLRIYNPLKGIIRTRPKSAIAFKIENPNEELELHYAFGGERRPKPVDLNCTGKTCSFEIQMTKETNTRLYIIANRQTALQYKVEVY
ncbi:MAG: hypothetical protein HKN90_03190 [Flavobacteriaceae bacterium]|nr:hypothetical protein [Flavobacteriaceae bacterium]